MLEAVQGLPAMDTQERREGMETIWEDLRGTRRCFLNAWLTFKCPPVFLKVGFSKHAVGQITWAV